MIKQYHNNSSNVCIVTDKLKHYTFDYDMIKIITTSSSSIVWTLCIASRVLVPLEAIAEA